jgi:hypothetical protein
MVEALRHLPAPSPTGGSERATAEQGP